MTTRNLAILLTVLIITSTVSAQSRADIGGSVSAASHALGYKGPAAGIVGHLVARHGRLGIEASADYLRAAKAQTGQGNAIHASAALRYYFGRVFVSGGVIAGRQTTSLYAKSAGGPSAGAGWGDALNTIQASYSHFFDENRSNGVDVSYERIVPVSERAFISVRPFATFSRFITAHPYDGLVRSESGVRAGVAVGIGRRW